MILPSSRGLEVQPEKCSQFEAHFAKLIILPKKKTNNFISFFTLCLIQTNILNTHFVLLMFCYPPLPPTPHPAPLHLTPSLLPPFTAFKTKGQSVVLVPPFDQAQFVMVNETASVPMCKEHITRRQVIVKRVLRDV